MVRAWRSADVTACHAVLNPTWCRISEKYNVSPLSILGHCFNVVSLNASLDSGENEYLVVMGIGWDFRIDDRLELVGKTDR